MTNVLVTGSRGFIASHLCHALSKLKINLIGVNRQNRAVHTPYGKTNFFEWEERCCDLNDEQQVKDLLKETQPDVIFHLSAIPTIKKDDALPCLISHSNILQTHYLLEHCKEGATFVFASSSVLYGESLNGPYPCMEASPAVPRSVYAATKLASEELVKVYHKQGKIKGRSLRLTATVGPNLTKGIVHDFINKLKAPGDELEVFGERPGSVKTFSYVTDVAKAFTMVGFGLDFPRYEVFNVGNADALSVEQVANMVMKTMGVNKFIKWCPEKTWRGDDNYIFVDTTKLDYYGWKRECYGSEVAIERAVREIINKQER